MKKLAARRLTAGTASGPAMVSRKPFNIAAAHTKPRNLLSPFVIRDHHHDLNGRDVRGHVLVVPTCVGSTYSGMVLFGLIILGISPVAIVVQEADPLLVSGLALAEVWSNRTLPAVECPRADLFDLVRDGHRIEVDANEGWIGWAGVSGS